MVYLQSNMSRRKKRKKQKIDYNNLTDPKRIEEQKFLARWGKNKPSSSVWEKIDDDPIWSSQFFGRPEGSMGNHWGVRKRYK